MKRVLAVGAHPDDVEIMCAGTLFLLARHGYEIHVATMTLGDCGSMEHGPEKIRRIRHAEAEDACHALGATYHYAGFDDCAIFNTDRANRRTTALLRDIDPEIVFTHPPHDYMTDHETTSVLIRNACFYGPVPNYDTQSFTSVRRSSSIPYLFYAQPLEGIDIFGKPVMPQFYIDIGDSIEAKLDMLARHKSQREWLRAHHGIDEYLDSVQRWCAGLGKQATAILGREVKYAEAMRQHLGHSYPRENPLPALFGDRLIRQPDSLR